MPRYVDIECDAVTEVIGRRAFRNREDIQDFLDNIPTADVQEVKHGYNVQADTPSLFQCSVCGWSDNDTYTGDTATYNYCPNCGARMDGGDAE